MSNVLKVQVQDEAGNIYYLHTSADIVFCEDGTSVEEKLKTGATQTVMGMLSAADKKKLDGVDENANNYTHPSSHPASMITQDSTHRFATDAEKTAWNAKASTAAATQSAAGLLSAADKKKLDGVATGANNYTHPSTHPASMITQDSTHRFATDAEKKIWNAAKQGAIDAIKALMSNSQTNNTGKIPTSALVYAMNQTLSGLNSKFGTVGSATLNGMTCYYTYSGRILVLNIRGNVKNAMAAFAEVSATLSNGPSGSSSAMTNVSNDFLPVLITYDNKGVVFTPTKALAAGTWVSACVALVV